MTRLQKIEIALEIIKTVYGCMLKQEEYVKIIKRDFSIDCNEEDLKTISQNILNREIEDFSIVYKNLGYG